MRKKAHSLTVGSVLFLGYVNSLLSISSRLNLCHLLLAEFAVCDRAGRPALLKLARFGLSDRNNKHFLHLGTEFLINFLTVRYTNI
jgi:hypothetical protein